MTTRRSQASGVGHAPRPPIWRPVTAVGMLTAVVAEQLKHTRAQLAVLEQARPGRPDAKILDNYTVLETLRIYGQLAADYRSLFAEQGRRWHAETIADTPARHAVDAYIELVKANLAVLDELLTLAGQIQNHTLEKIMAKKRPRTKP